VIAADAPLAVEAVALVQAGDVDALTALLALHPELVTARFGDESMSRTLLHAATDWPGSYPNGPQIVAALVAAGADVNARFAGPHRETPLHWAASSDDVAMIDALLDAGADIEADGAVLTDGTPLADAVVFGQWLAARRLVERGAALTLWQAAALGPPDLVRRIVVAESPAADELTNALWHAARAGHRWVAEYLVSAGADPMWIGHDHLTPSAVAAREGHTALATWLASH
jgi:ankyrin repeat protein